MPDRCRRKNRPTLCFYSSSTVLRKRRSTDFLLRSKSYISCRALYDNPQWRNSTLATQGRIFLYHHRTTTCNGSSRNAHSSYVECVVKLTFFPKPVTNKSSNPSRILHRSMNYRNLKTTCLKLYDRQI